MVIRRQDLQGSPAENRRKKHGVCEVGIGSHGLLHIFIAVNVIQRAASNNIVWDIYSSQVTPTDTASRPESPSRDGRHIQPPCKHFH